MDRRDLNMNQNYKTNNRRNDVSLKEWSEELKETFVKEKEPESSHTTLEDVTKKTMKSLIVCDSSYKN